MADQQITIQVEENKIINVTDVLGTLRKADAAPTVKGLYFLEEVGNYTNLGLVAQDMRLNYATFDGTNWRLSYKNLPSPNVTNINNSYNVDPEQIVPSEALYDDETLAGDILKRVEKFTSDDVNFRETTKWNDGSNMLDSKVDGHIFRKIGSKFYAREIGMGVNVKWFGAKGDGIFDDKIAVQKAVDFCEKTGTKTLYFPHGNYYLSDAVYIRRGGFDILGSGILRREESWQNSWGKQHFPNIYTEETTYEQKSMHQCTILVEKDKSAFIFDRSVCDGFKISKIGFRPKSGQRTIGNTRAIVFLAEFPGPTWTVEIEECHFNSFNKAFHVNSSLGYCLAFVRFYNNSFSHNDECVFYDFINDDIRNISWGFDFINNKAHDNSRVIYGRFAKLLVNIKGNNMEGSIPKADGTFADYSVDIELDNACCVFSGNHFEAAATNAVYITSFARSKNGSYQPTNGTTALSNFNKVEIYGNNMDGLNLGGSQGHKEFTLEGLTIFNRDNYYLYLHACEIVENFTSSNNIFLSEKAKERGTTLIFSNNIEIPQFTAKDNYPYFAEKEYNTTDVITIGGKEYLKSDIADFWTKSPDFDFDGNPAFFILCQNYISNETTPSTSFTQPKSSRSDGFKEFNVIHGQSMGQMLTKMKGKSTFVTVIINQNFWTSDAIKNYLKASFAFGPKVLLEKKIFGYYSNEIIKPIIPINC